MLINLLGIQDIHSWHFSLLTDKLPSWQVAPSRLALSLRPIQSLDTIESD